MNGTRLYINEGEPAHGSGFVYRVVSQSGAYGFDGTQWWGCTPTGLPANLVAHTVVENEDKTITVTPSILVQLGVDGPSWHGYLTQGVWKEC